ncbi:helix-turn-helix domain-containing protein [Stenotrophomonas terrae]|uniref:GlxA family transcriptional regulator n=1 Tax=Stenotrophomonas terrae TaxID=405446 RepID=UPI00320994FC
MRTDGHIQVGILLYPGAQLAAVLGLTDLFALADRLSSERATPAAPELQVTHWRIEAPGQAPQAVYSSSQPPTGTPQVMILPPSMQPPISTEAAAPYLGWLRALHDDGTTLASVCAGAFLLAETGRLAGRTITTNWQYAELLAARFPDVTLDVDQMLIDGGDIFSAGGAMAWTDLGLRLVDRYLGAVVMLDVARTLLIDPPGRQQRYYSSFSPRMTHGDAAVLAVQQWLHDTHAKQVASAELAQRAGLEERTFLRRFQKATGMTATEYCQRVRVARAREMLQTSNVPLERIAWDVGYSDPGSFRKVFSRIVGLSPGEYRRRFGGR